MNDGGGDGAGCFDIKEWANTTELTNVEVAGLGKCSYLVGKRKKINATNRPTVQVHSALNDTKTKLSFKFVSS